MVFPSDTCGLYGNIRTVRFPARELQMVKNNSYCNSCNVRTVVVLADITRLTVYGTNMSVQDLRRNPADAAIKK